MKQFSRLIFFLSSFLAVFLAATNWCSPLGQVLRLWHDRATPPISPGCPNHNYQIYVFSKDPLVIYISSFLSADETKELASLREANLRTTL
jgi:hypothetical protein